MGYRRWGDDLALIRLPRKACRDALYFSTFKRLKRLRWKMVHGARFTVCGAGNKSSKNSALLMEHGKEDGQEFTVFQTPPITRK
jgi:hypothetical protein